MREVEVMLTLFLDDGIPPADDLAGDLEGAIRNGRDLLKLMTEAGQRYTLALKNERVLRNQK